MVYCRLNCVPQKFLNPTFLSQTVTLFGNTTIADAVVNEVKLRSNTRPGVVVHACNPSSLGDQGGQIT